MDAAHPLAADAWDLTAGRRRALLGVAGPPGAGKSTLAARIVDSLREQHGEEAVAMLPLDGFHLSQAELARLGLTDRKGSPPTFDVHGYLALLRRVLAGTGNDIWAPDFDRALDEPVAARHRIPAAARLVVTEGNYLLCELPVWREVKELTSACWYLDAPAALRMQRLVERHVGGGQDVLAARARAESNDVPNSLLVEASRARADRVLDGVSGVGSADDEPPT